MEGNAVSCKHCSRPGQGHCQPVKRNFAEEMNTFTSLASDNNLNMHLDHLMLSCTNQGKRHRSQVLGLRSTQRQEMMAEFKCEHSWSTCDMLGRVGEQASRSCSRSCCSSREMGVRSFFLSRSSRRCGRWWGCWSMCACMGRFSSWASHSSQWHT